MNYATAGSRFLAFLIDVVILMVIQAILGMVVGDNASASTGLSLLVTVGYYVFYQQRMGQTVGKKAMKIKVVDASGNTPTLGIFALREVVGKFVSGIILCIGYLMILWDPKKQGLHDKIASTYVVKA